MINGAHVLLYTAAAEQTRVFLRDVLGFPHVDAGDGWLIYALPPGELAVHPIGADGAEGGDSPPVRHELYLMCDDIDATVEELGAKGVEFASPVTDQGWGRLTSIRLPGGGELGIYQPRHRTAHELTSD